MINIRAKIASTIALASMLLALSLGIVAVHKIEMEQGGMGSCAFMTNEATLCPLTPLHNLLAVDADVPNISILIMSVWAFVFLAVLHLARLNYATHKWRDIFKRNLMLRIFDHLLMAFAQGLLKPKRPVAVTL